MNSVFLNGLGVSAPGLDGWASAKSILSGIQSFSKTEMEPPKPMLIPPRERRRTTSAIRLAIKVAEEALDQSGLSWEEVQSVFTSADGDMDITDRICKALAQPDRPVSPTQFHNSVHNAPAGYWAIAIGSMQASTSLAASTGSFAAGLLEAAVSVQIENNPLMLVAYDYPAPHPLSEIEPLQDPFGTAFLISREPLEKSFCCLEYELSSGCEESRILDDEMEAMRKGNPSGRALPLLQAIASNDSCQVVLPYGQNNQLIVRVRPC